MGNAHFRREPQMFAGNRRKPQIGVCPLRFVPLSAALKTIREEIIYTRILPLPPFLAKRHFSGEGGGVSILSPYGAGISNPPPPFYTPPTPRRVFIGVRGWGCIKIGPVNKGGELRGGENIP